MAPRHTMVLSVSTLGLAALLIAQCLTYAEAQNNGTANARQGKVFSLFNVVQFQNTGCRSTSSLAGTTGTTSPYRNGTCYTAAECSSKGGQAAGQCAAGFGVCCVFIYSTSASTVSQNCSYIRNPGFPSAYAGTAAVTYTIQKTCPTVCSLRLDFEMFSTLGPATTVEATSCPDSFTVTTNPRTTIPTICGINTGQHIYVDMGAGSSDSATLNFAFTGSSTSRLWDIKVTQVLCGQPGSQPTGCLQWYTGITGRLTTFNFAPTTSSHLPNQDYSQCIRAEAGYCCIKYFPCADTNSFSLNGIGSTTTAGTAAPGMSGVDSLCSTTDYVGIAGSSGSCQVGSTQSQLFNKYCGAQLNTVTGVTGNIAICDCTQPFVVGIYTDATNAAMSAAIVDGNRGVCLNYMQIPCTAT